MTASLEGVRVLVVEDEMLVCMDIEDMLVGFGCEVVGPAARVDQALELVERAPIDLAMLDINLGREKSYPIAERLASRGIPFLISTGYAEVDAPFDARPRLQKPFSRKDLAACLRDLRPACGSAWKRGPFAFSVQEGAMRGVVAVAASGLVPSPILRLLCPSSPCRRSCPAS